MKCVPKCSGGSLSSASHRRHLDGDVPAVVVGQEFTVVDQPGPTSLAYLENHFKSPARMVWLL
eukprot:2271741-Pyramimonas_sp.AAC.1